VKLRPVWFLVVLTAVPLCADVTEKVALRLEPGPDLPPQLTESIAKQLLGSSAALSFEVRLKGSRASLRTGNFFAVSDFDGAIVTVLDSAGRRYATAGADEYQRIQKDLLAAAAAKSESHSRSAMELRISTPPHPTGKTKKLHGIDVAEQELTLTAPVGTSAMSVRMSLWCATERERVNNPAILELQRYTDRSYIPAGLASNMANAIGSGTDAKFMAEFVKSLLSLGTCLEMRVSYLGPGGEDMMHLVQEMTEFSTAAIPEAEFETPRSYAVARMEDLLASQSTRGEVKAAPVLDEPSSDPDRPKLQRKK
jgi:hypothetical protein